MPRRDKKRKLVKKDGDSAPREISSIDCGDAESPSVYLVVGHESTHPAYSVFEVNPFADGGDGEVRMRIRHRMRLASLHAKHCMAFVPMRSRYGLWIVGVGGDSAHENYGPETIVFDTKTRAVITGPKLVATKFYPVLLPVGDKIYSLSRNPDVKKEPDFVPWFEVLDLSEAQVLDDTLVGCEWKPLPRPPFFPWELTPRQYIVPPEVTVKSYVAVGSCILVSVTGQTGTHMFDTETEHWVKLDDRDLPFTKVCNTSASLSVKTECHLSLSIVEFPIVTDKEGDEEVGSSSRFVSLGDRGFCSLSCWMNDSTLGPEHTRELVSVRAYTSQDHSNTFGNLLVPNQRKQVYSIHDSFRGLTWPCLEAVISF
ncbi:hypothetical protein QOZ80_6AG0540620 [Eleusine coracana subsp. coracana]|nr:hypothetical protein QOZ80_6AG0540620 [Eleusine coracana subsp. coracana]